MNNDKKGSNLTHDRLQQEIFMYARNTYKCGKTMWHTPNELQPYPGESKNAFMIRCSIRKSIGVVSGVLDLVLYRAGILHILDIKIGTDTLSDNQIAFINDIEAQGGKHHIIENIEQGKKVIDQIFTPNN